MNEKLNQISDKATQTVNWLKKQIMENWRLILVAAIVVIISLNAFQNEKTSKQNNQPTPSTQETQNNIDNSENTANASNTANTDVKAQENTSASSSDNQNSFAQTAQKGEGMTHLARRAIKGYLEQNGKTLTSEQKIYAEDYVRKITPAQKIKSGQILTFNEETIKTAVEKSEKLTEKQIKNLGKFVPLVKNL